MNYLNIFQCILAPTLVPTFFFIHLIEMIEEHFLYRDTEVIKSAQNR